MGIDNMLFEIVEGRKFFVHDLNKIFSTNSIRLPNNLKINALMSEVESSYGLLHRLKEEFEKNLSNIAPRKKNNFIINKINEIKKKYHDCPLEESILDWPLDILAFRVRENHHDLDLTYFAGQLVYNYSPGKNYGYQFEDELIKIAQGVADYELLQELGKRYGSVIKDSSIKSAARNLKRENNERTNKSKSESSIKITIDRDHAITLWKQLKPYFEVNDHEWLRQTLLGENGESRPLVFGKRGGETYGYKFLEVFRRLHYNGLIKGTRRSTIDWISHHFSYIVIKAGKDHGKPKPFTRYHISNYLSKEMGDIPDSKDRICDKPFKYKSLEDLKAEK